MTETSLEPGRNEWWGLLNATLGQILNVGGPEEFARSIDNQRAKLAAFAAKLGVKPIQ